MVKEFSYQPVSRMDCSQCHTALLIARPVASEFEIKLPGHCPCCLTALYSYCAYQPDDHPIPLPTVKK